MNWYEWVFSGIGVLVLSYFTQRWLKSGQNNAAALTAQGAKVKGSPIASGSGITQLVNSPTTVTLNVSPEGSTALPSLQLEVREVCFDDVLHSVEKDWSQFTVGRYIFVRLWVVNTAAVPTTVKHWMLTFSSGGSDFPAKLVDDFSALHKNS